MSKTKPYAEYADRLQSYVGWPRRYVQQTPESLAAAGFFYIGSADRVTCFCCHERFRNWRPGQDPLAVHKLVSPDCIFIRSIGSGKKDEENEDSSKSSVSGSAVETVDSRAHDVLAIGDEDYPIDVFNSVLYGCQEGAYSRDMVYTVGYVSHTLPAGVKWPVNVDLEEKKTQETKASSISTTKITTIATTTTATTTADNTFKEKINASNTTEESGKSKTPATQASENKEKRSEHDLVSRVKKENMMLKNQRLCKICLKNEVGILVLPCSHIVFCSECVNNETKCAKCGMQIRGTVKVFLP